MGSALISELLEIPLQDPDQAMEVAGSPEAKPISAMRIGRCAKTSELIFEKEVPLLFGNVPVTAYCKLISGDGREDYRHLTWDRFEAKPQIDTLISTNDHLVVAFFPYRSGWSFTGRFKTGYHDPRRKPDLSDETVRSREEAADRFESYSHNLREASRTKVAGISVFSDSLLDEEANAVSLENLWKVFGVCSDPDAKANELAAHSHCIKLRKIIDNGLITINGKVYELPFSVATAVNTFIFASIYQAMAGPHEEDTSDWIGEPVIKKFDYVLRGHLQRCVRSQSWEEKEHDAIRSIIDALEHRQRIRQLLKRDRRQPGPKKPTN